MTDLAGNNTVEEHFKQKEVLEQNKESTWFSKDIHLTEQEKKVDKVLKGFVSELVTKVFNPCIHDYMDNLKPMMRSNLYKFLKEMPKGGVHHIHVTAAPSVETYIELTYDESVYFCEREMMFKVYPLGLEEDGYIKTAELRRFSRTPDEFDSRLRNFILVQKAQYEQSTASTWQAFQHKFAMLTDLGKYVKFFKRIMKEVMQKAAEQHIFILELRHTPGRLFDEQRKTISLAEELKLIEGILSEVQEEHPHFDLALIFCGFKIAGRDHIRKVIQDYFDHQGMSDLITGFDMINQEDITPQVVEFAEDILKGKEECLDDMPCYLHVGESHDRHNCNVVDALLLGSKRIGHGFQIGFNPKIVDKLIEKNVCLECCPISNRLLGYTHDLRNHPVRYLLNRGLQISVSSDDPGFFGYDGVALDFATLVLAWELDIRDLKKLAVNGVDYSSVSEDRKAKVKAAFTLAWDAFIAKFAA